MRSGQPGSLEEDWYFQALQECYLPLLAVLEAAAADPAQQPRLTMGLSPTLLSLLSDPLLNARFTPWLEQRLALLAEAPAALAEAAADLGRRGLVTAPDGTRFGASGFIVNCPIVAAVR